MLSCEHCGSGHDPDALRCPVTNKLFRPERLFPFGSLLEGKYRLDSVLGAGGMGAVFRATHVLLNKAVAVKLTLPDLATDREMMARMVREARAASATGHRNIAGVTDMGWTETGGLYLVMEYLDGITLHELVTAGGPAPVGRAARIMSQVLSGLSAVHARGIVHRDLKPENVMLVQDEQGQEQAKILDFGISKVITDDKSLELTRTGLVLGSPRYMSPEQARGLSDVDHRADIYASGGMLYTLLVGQPPLSAPNYHAMLSAIVAGDIRPPSETLPSIPRALDQLVLKAMAVDRSRRFQHAQQMQQALLPFCVEQPAGAVRSLGPLPVAASESVTPDWSEESLVMLDGAEACEEQSQAQQQPTRPRVPIAVKSVQSSPSVAPAQRRRQGDDDRRFMPSEPQVDEPLELDSQGGWRGAAAKAVTVAPHATNSQTPQTGTLYEAARVRGRPLIPGWLLAGVVLIVVGGAGWHFRGKLSDLLGLVDDNVDVGSVLLRVETKPENAEVYVDGVLQVTRPIELPRSSRLFSVRVRASGYRSKIMQVRADKAHNLIVSLQRRR